MQKKVRRYDLVSSFLISGEEIIALLHFQENYEDLEQK